MNKRGDYQPNYDGKQLFSVLFDKVIKREYMGKKISITL